MEKYTDGKFSNQMNPQDEFVVSEYKDARARRILKFLVPILYSEKITQVTIMVGNTIFGVLFGERKVD